MHALQPYTFRLPATPPPFARAGDPSVPWHPAASVVAEAPWPAAPRPAARWVWQSRFGAIVIEVRGDDVYVNGDRVEPHVP